MVGAVGFEGLGAYRPWRDLGASFARAGIPACRLTLPGTGDAPEPDGLPDLVSRWLDAVDAASDWMERALHLDEVVLCGFGLGALLIARAASRAGGTERIALLSPPISGKQFLRAEQARARIAGFPSTARVERLELPALHLHRSAARELESLSLAGPDRAPARRVLLLTRGGVAEANVLTKAMEAHGSEIQAETFEGHSALASDAYLSRRPDADWKRLVTWVGEGLLGPRSPVRPLLLTPPLAGGEVTGAGWVERPVRIPTAQGLTLAGMYAGPSGTAPPGGVAVVVVSSGANPHAGYGRGAAYLCRRLAASGTWSLRFDFSGVGDSDGDEEMDLARLFGPTCVVETRAVLDWMGSRGHTSFVLVGLCSGGFQAMQAGLVDGRVEGLVLANVPFYGVWQGGGLKGWQRRREALASRAVRQGEVNAPQAASGLVKRRQLLWGYLLRVGLQAGLRLEEWMVEIGRQAGFGAPRRCFRALAARGVRTLVIAGENDASLALLEAHFGAGARNLAFKDVELVVVPRFDHSLGMAAAQQCLADNVVCFVAESGTRLDAQKP
jgi:alpha-beta hydrolase superfamily lysophospholipase